MSMPATNIDFWTRKLSRNVERDAENRQALEALGWSVVVIWECETRKTDNLIEALRVRMGPKAS